jgi:RecB family exonuclease
VSWTPAPSSLRAGGARLSGEPLSVGEASATWRRQLADLSASEADRLAAIDGLRALGVDPARWWFQRNWTDTGRPLRDQIRTSYSRLDVLENCELQFVLASELGLGSFAGYHAWVGKLVHKLIEDCENGLVDRTLDALCAEVDKRWRPGEFPSLAVSEEFRRLVTGKMLPHWMDQYGDTPALGREVGFSFEIDGATITGYIDRIGPILSGGNRITDYKTGKPDNAGPAETNLQLGIYWLAVGASEELAEFRPVRAVELAFIKGDWRGNFAARKYQPSGKRAAEYEKEMTERVSGLIGRIRELNETEVYRPNPGASCMWCDFKKLCPLYPEGSAMLPASAGSGASPSSQGGES